MSDVLNEYGGDIIARKCGLTKADQCPGADDSGSNPLVNPATTERTAIGATAASACQGNPIPVVFGYARVDGAPFFVNPLKHGIPGAGKQCVAVALSKGPILNVETEDTFLDSIRSSSYSLVQLVEKHLGAFNQAISSHLVSSTATQTPQYFQKHPGLAYIVWDFDEGWNNANLPVFGSYISGYANIYDPRLSGGAGGYGWTDNLALISAEVMCNQNFGGRISRAFIDNSSLTDCANYYDQYTNIGSALTLTGAVVTGGKCIITTSQTHGMNIGDPVYIAGVQGTIGTNLNGKYWRVREYASDHVHKFTLAALDMTFPSTTGWGTFTAGGSPTVQPCRKLGVLNLCARTQASLKQQMDTARGHANMQIIQVGGLYRFYADKWPDSGAVFTFDGPTPGYDVAKQQWSDCAAKDVPSAVQITFYGQFETKYGGYYRTDVTSVVQYPPQSTAIDPSRVWKYQFEGSSNANAMLALATLLYKWGLYGGQQGSFECSSEALELIPWSVINLKRYLDYAQGSAVKVVRLIEVNLLADRTAKISWRQTDSRIYA